MCACLAALMGLAGTTARAEVTPVTPQLVDGVYQIGTAAELQGFAKLVNDSQTDGSFAYTGASAALTADIDMAEVENYTPISAWMVKNTDHGHWYGTFDGQGHSISNLRCEVATNGLFGVEGQVGDMGGAALFGTVGTGAVIRNLTIEQSCSFNNTLGRSAAFVAYMGHRGTPEATEIRMENLVNRAYVTGRTQVCGIVARPVAESYALFTLVMNNCINEGEIVADPDASATAGLVADALAPIVMTDCRNRGNVSGKQPVGGFYGYSNRSITFTRCVNEGTVTGTAAWVGGFVGRQNSGAYTITISECQNTGAVTGGSTSVGGFVAKSEASSTIVMEKCYNTAPITGTGCVGGLLGNTQGGANYGLTITDCYNTGEITGTGTKSGTGQVGGLIGCGNYKGVITHCWNTGAVTGNYYYVGGIIGSSGGTQLEMTDVYNEGRVTNSSHYTGGVVGLTNTAVATAVLTRCRNLGEVDAAGQNVGGIVGTFYKEKNGTLTLNECWNEGYVHTSCSNDAIRVGGFIGWLRGEAGNTIVANRSYNTGTIEAADKDHAGIASGLVGIAGGNTIVRLTDCYNTGDVKALAVAAGLASETASAKVYITSCWNSGAVTGAQPDVLVAVSSGENTTTTLTNTYDVKNDGPYAAATLIPDYRPAWLSDGHLAVHMNEQADRFAWFQDIGADDTPVLDYTHGVPYLSNGQCHTANDDALEGLISLLQDKQRQYLYENTAYADGELIAQQSLIDEYDAAIEALAEITVLRTLLDTYDSLLVQRAVLQQSADAYTRYMTRIDEIRQQLAADADLKGHGREVLEAYLDGDDEPGTLYPNGAYAYILKSRLLDAEGIEAEIEFAGSLLAAALLGNYQAGSDITALLTNADFSKPLTTGWEGVMATGKTTATLTSPDGSKTADFTGVEYSGSGSFDMHQTLRDLKGGLYLVSMNAAQRPSTNIDSRNLNYSASLYANGNNTYVNAAVEALLPVADARDQVTANLTGAQPDILLTDESGEALGYMIGGQLGMAIAANAGRCQNYILASVQDGDSLTIGIKSPGTGAGTDWTGFANTGLIYLGALDGDLAGEALDRVLAGQAARATAIADTYEPDPYSAPYTYPNFGDDLRDALRTAVGEVEQATGNAAKYALVETFSRLFDDVYACKQAYMRMFRYGDLAQIFAVMVRKAVDEETYNSYLDIAAILQGAFTDGTYSLQDALDMEPMSVLDGVDVRDENGTLQISTPVQLAWFSAVVNTMDTRTNAAITADLDMTGVEYMPAGTYASPYSGTLDGQGHTLSNLTIMGETDAGLIGSVQAGAVVRNLLMDATCYVYGSKYVAAFVGSSKGTSGTITLENLGSDCDVESAGINVAGIFGANRGQTAKIILRNCFATGHLTSTGESGAISAWIGSNGSQVISCWTTSVVDGIQAENRYLARYGGTATFTNCFSKYGTQVTRISEEETELSSGELTWKLNGSDNYNETPAWRQTIGIDMRPQLFSGDVVYYYAGEYGNSQPDVHMNAYAYDLDSRSDAGHATVTFSLNDQARAGRIHFYAAGEEVVTEELSADDLTAGSHAVSVENARLGADGTPVTFEVEITSMGVTEPVRVPTPASGNYYRANGVRSLAFNDNPESKGFGTLYAAEGKYTRDVSNPMCGSKLQGLFAFTPTFEHILAADSTPGFLGRLAIGGDGVRIYDSNAAYDPNDVVFTRDGRLLISRMGGHTNSSLYEANPDSLDEDWTPVFAGGRLDSTSSLVYVGDEVQHGQFGAFTTSGEGEDLKVWAIMGGRSNGVSRISDYFTCVYDLGTKKEYTGLPTRYIEALTGQYTWQTSNLTIASDGQGGLWYAAHNDAVNAARPSMLHVNAEGAIDYRNTTTSAQDGALYVSADGSRLVVAGGSNTMYVYSVNYVPAEDGLITLNLEQTIRTGHSQASAVTFDYAGNMYVAGYSGHYLSRYVLPSPGDVVTTTPSGRRAAFRVGETKTGVSLPQTARGTDTIYRPDGVRISLPQRGVNIVNGRKVVR